MKKKKGLSNIQLQARKEFKIEVFGAIDLSKPEGKQISMFEQKGFIKTTKKNKK